jgi:hypothetical protein
MNINDGICGYVAGGLGNQLFILAAAWEQARRLQSPLYLDTSHYNVPGTRDFALGAFESPVIELGLRSPWTSFRVSKERIFPFPKRFNPLRQAVFLERDVALFDNRINSIDPGTTLLGYFQSEQYFPSITEDLAAGISGFAETSQENDIIGRMRSDPRITVHLRRGDYLSPVLERQMIASASYAKRAIDVLDNLGVEPRVRVFSDSPDIIRKEVAGWDADVEVVDSVDALSPMSTIKAMATGTGFVMSNSSFSWWAAWLMQEKASTFRTVVAPRPWIGSGSARVDMLKKDWLTLDARP